ncbi:helix-turn-helix transcriptional regulator [Streptomyces sp. MST-110588]|uniref:helix-turn-helix domain-containing protein n=1 Tax=Streptomyces sp. MST-110588 TaxID=2833628 RepID=UPI001F5DE1B7|nr:helix-turn-helix transcriptional regulator [Streptomyces sp. MST-110588]UNO41226.1 helix-turn-helix domain-containing protein [Streptomyces sp. MST-110588]
MTSETEEFAALLRGLKEKSGRSYGVLAKRLHMSTSTLHRYCNGDAVPVEYAPVERLARVCGASPEELVELHRRWILADATRGRKPGTHPAPAPGADGPAPVSGADGPAPVAAADDPVRGEASPEGGVPAGGATDDSTIDASGNDDSGDSDSANDGGVAGDGAVGRDATVGGGAVGGASGVAVFPAVLSPRRTLPKKLWLPLAGAAVVALAVPFMVNGSDVSGKRSAAATRADRASVSGQGPVPDGAVSRSPQATSATDRVAKKADAGTKKDSGPSEGPSGSAPEPESVPAAGDGRPKDGGQSGGDEGGDDEQGVPLTVDVRMNNWDDRCGRWFLLDKPPAEVPPPPTEQGTRGWANALGAVAAGHLRIALAVQGKSERAVVLHALHVRVTGRRAPASGAMYNMDAGCGGGLTPAAFDVALDAAAPLPRPVAGMQGDKKIPATDFPYKVSSSDPQVLDVDAHTDLNDVSWYLELEWSSGDRRGTLRLDDHGRPFRTSGMKGRPVYTYRYDLNVWRPEGT